MSSKKRLSSLLDYMKITDDDDEYENVADAFDEYLDKCEFDEIVDDDM